MKNPNPITLDCIHLKNGIYYLSEPKPDPEFEKVYLKARTIEKRIFTDEEVKKLPNTSDNSPLKKEWSLRVRSTRRFVSYLKEKRKKNILEVGCGNGWFCAQVAQLDGHKIIGVDINILELEQASRLFTKPDLIFAYGDIFEDIFSPEVFDVIVINSAIQYFPDIEKLVKRLFYFLTAEGEIHFVDSPFYNDNELKMAKERTHQYYKSIDCAEMANLYYHHPFANLRRLNFKMLYNPVSLQNKILRKLKVADSPFPWIRIKKN